MPTSEEYRARHRAYQKKWSAAHPDRVAAYGANYRATHREEKAAKDSAYNSANREKIKIQKRYHYVANRDEMLIQFAAYRASHRTEIAAYKAAHHEEGAAYNTAYHAAHREEGAASRLAYYTTHHEQELSNGSAYRVAHRSEIAAYSAAHPENAIAHQATRRTRKTAAGGSFTSDEFKALCDKYGNQCIGPGPHSPGKLHADHVIPVVLGGSSDISNIQPLCQHCNLSKATKSTDFRAAADYALEPQSRGEVARPELVAAQSRFHVAEARRLLEKTLALGVGPQHQEER